MKKMYILLVTIMIFALLAGCAQPTQAPEPTKAEAEGGIIVFLLGAVTFG